MKIKINFIQFFLVIVFVSIQSIQPQFETNSISEKIEIEDLINFSTCVSPTTQHQLLRIHNLPFILNTTTNTADNLPSIQDSLEIIEKNIFSYDTNEIQKILDEILNVLKIASKVLEINKEHEKFKNPIPADFLEKINNYEYKIYNLINKINQKKL